MKLRLMLIEKDKRTPEKVNCIEPEVKYIPKVYL